MALWYTIYIDRLKVDDREFELSSDKHKRKLLFHPFMVARKEKPYEIKLDYFSGNEIKVLGLFGEKLKKEILQIDETFDFDEVMIEIVSPPEEKRDIKNLGTGAIAGALVAGPIGAAAGAWLGTKVKDVELKVKIPKKNILLLGRVATGFIAAWQKASTSSALKDDF